MFGVARINLHFFRSNARWITGGFLLTFFSSFGQTFFIGMSGNDLRQTFHLSGGELGGIYMVATLASAATLPWLGRALDLMPGWKVARFSMPALAIACVLIALAPNIAVLTFSIYLLRLFGQGMMTEIAFTMIGRWFATNRGRAMALITPGQQVGSAILPVVVVFITWLSSDWRAAWLAAATVIVLVGLPKTVSLIRVERAPQPRELEAARQHTARDWTRAEVIRDPLFYMLLGGTLAPPFIGTTILFHQGYLIALRGYPPLAFAAAYPIMSISTIVFGFVCGALVDRFGALRILPFFLIPMAIASTMIGVIEPLWGVYVFMLLLGMSNGFTQTLVGTLWPEIYGTDNLGGIRALTVAAMVLATAAGPGIVGALMDLGIALPTQLIWLSGWCVTASFLLASAARRLSLRKSLATVCG